MFKGWIWLGSHWTSFGILPNFDVDVLSASHAFLGVNQADTTQSLLRTTQPQLCWLRRGPSQGSPQSGLSRGWRGMSPAGDLLWAPQPHWDQGSPSGELSCTTTRTGAGTQRTPRGLLWGGPSESPDQPSPHHTCPRPTFPASDPVGLGWHLGVCIVKVCQIRGLAPFPRGLGRRTQTRAF